LTEAEEATAEHERIRQIRRYAARVGVAALCLFVLFTLWRFAGESDRQTRRTERVAANLETEIRADCEFKLRVAQLPTLTRYPSEAVVSLATAARTAYIRKGCAGSPDPDTGRVFPPAPPTYRAVPSPTVRAPTP
jgi:hypothetical protein